MSVTKYWKILICAIFSCLLSSCLTYYVERNYKTDDTTLFSEGTEDSYISIKSSVHTWLSPCKPFIDIHDDYSYRFVIKTKNYKNIDSIIINEIKILFPDSVLDILNEIDIEENNDEHYITLDKNEYEYFKEFNRIKIYQNDEISIWMNDIKISYAKTKNIKIKTSINILFNDGNNVLFENETIHKRKPKRGLAFVLGR